MDGTKVVNIRNEPFDVKICRTKGNTIPPAPEPGCFGNPFFLKDVNDDEERNRVVEKYREYFYNKINTDPEFYLAVMQLKGKRLGCFCAPKRCHGDVIVEYLNTVDALDKLVNQAQELDMGY